MQYYFAPLEGLTDSTYRRLHNQYFPGLDRYYTPFFSPAAHRSLTAREQRELPPADTLGYKSVPQLLTKNPDDFIWMAEQCANLGYDEVNLNLGCPSGTVTAKGKGAGLLRQTDVLDEFLNNIFKKTPVPISIKTRIGFQQPEEFPAILDIFNRYPIRQLIIHPRVRNAFYKGAIDFNIFTYALQNSKAPVCYNGNLCTAEDISSLMATYPNIGALMLGRGLIGDPGMLSPKGTDRKTLQEFHDHLLEEYLVLFGGSRNAMFRLKENWSYLICKFEDPAKLGKQIRKTTDIQEYRDITREIFETLPMCKSLSPNW